MSVEARVEVGDVILAKNRSTGEEYYAFGEVDDDCPWSFNEEPIGSGITWTRDFVIGPTDTTPEDFWAGVIYKLFKWEETDTPITDNEKSEYLTNAKKLARMLLQYTDYELVAKDEFRSRRKFPTDPESMFSYPFYIALPYYAFHKMNLESWCGLSTSIIDDITEEDAERIWVLIYNLSIFEYEQIATHFDDFAFMKITGKFHGCMSYILTDNLTGRECREPEFYRSDGYFYCYKKDSPYRNSEDWKSKYYEYVQDITYEFNCLNNYQSYWFCSASVETVKKMYFETMESMLSGCQSLVTGGSYGEELASLFTGDKLSLREYIREAGEDSCGGYYDEDYFGVMRTYLDDLDLEFVCVVDPRVKVV